MRDVSPFSTRLSPSGTRLRCDLPEPLLRPFVGAYMIYSLVSDLPSINWFLPANPVISIVLDGWPVEIMTLEGKFEASGVSLIGSTTRAYRAKFRGGIIVNVELTPLGWRRMMERPAQRLTDRVTPLSDVLGSSSAKDLLNALKLVDNDGAIAHVLDRHLSEMFRHEITQEVDNLAAVLLGSGTTSVAEAAAQLELSKQQLLRLSRSVFGMSPKLVIRRTRLLRAVQNLLLSQKPRINVDDVPGYFDASHFLRDAVDFLGATPRQFINEETLLLRAGLSIRGAVTGYPIHALQR